MNLRKVAGLILLGIGACSVMAALPAAPEIDPLSGVNALAAGGRRPRPVVSRRLPKLDISPRHPSR